jgi:hypothetical protein
MTIRKRPARENKRYWLSFDLGLRGNYDSLYEWLDAHSASESGDSLATRRRTSLMERDWRRLASMRSLVFMDDQPYRDEAFELCPRALDKPPASYRPLSLTDRVLRGVLADTNARIDALMTFNIGDFADVCRKAGRQIVS